MEKTTRTPMVSSNLDYSHGKNCPFEADEDILQSLFLLLFTTSPGSVYTSINLHGRSKSLHFISERNQTTFSIPLKNPQKSQKNAYEHLNSEKLLIWKPYIGKSSICCMICTCGLKELMTKTQC